MGVTHTSFTLDPSLHWLWNAMKWAFLSRDPEEGLSCSQFPPALYFSSLSSGWPILLYLSLPQFLYKLFIHSLQIWRESAYSYKMLVLTYNTAWCHNAKYYNLNYDCCEDLNFMASTLFKINSVMLNIFRGVTLCTLVVHSKNTIFWDSMMCSPVEIQFCFMKSYCLHLQSQSIRQANIQQ